MQDVLAETYTETKDSIKICLVQMFRDTICTLEGEVTCCFCFVWTLQMQNIQVCINIWLSRCMSFITVREQRSKYARTVEPSRYVCTSPGRLVCTRLTESSGRQAQGCMDAQPMRPGSRLGTLSVNNQLYAEVIQQKSRLRVFIDTTLRLIL